MAISRTPRSRCRLGVAQEPESVAEAAEADGFRIQPVVDQMGAPVFGTVALDGGLEVLAGHCQLALPEGGDAKHVVALHQKHVVRVLLAACAQLLAKPLRPGEIALGQAGDRQRAQEWRRQFDAERRGELERAPVHVGKTGRGEPFRHAEHRR